MSERVTVRERGATEWCPFCRDTLDGEDEVLRCGTCETRLHGACFRDNGLACTVLGCGGRAVVAPTPAATGRRPRESKRERKRRLREEQRAARRASRSAVAASAWTPHTTPALAPIADDTPWHEGPLGLIGILGLLFVLPGLGASLGQPGLSVVGLVGGTGWLIAFMRNAGRPGGRGRASRRRPSSPRT